MGHLVRYRTADGELRHEDVGDLDAALVLVEELRNTGDVGDVRVYREVPLKFQTIVKVSVADEDTPAVGTTEAAADAPQAAADADVPPPAPVEPPPGSMPLVPPVAVTPQEPVQAEDSEKRSLFHR